MTSTNQPVSPLGSTSESAAKRRYDTNPGYRAEHDRLAPYRAIASAVILARSAQGITQTELAARIGTTGSAISRLESGRHPVALETLTRLGIALDIVFVIGATGASKPTSSTVIVPEGAVERRAARPAAAAVVRPKAKPAAAVI